VLFPTYTDVAGTYWLLGGWRFALLQRTTGREFCRQFALCFSFVEVHSAQQELNSSAIDLPGHLEFMSRVIIFHMAR